MWRAREEWRQCRIGEERRHSGEKEVVVPCDGER